MGKHRAKRQHRPITRDEAAASIAAAVEQPDYPPILRGWVGDIDPAEGVTARVTFMDSVIGRLNDATPRDQRIEAAGLFVDCVFIRCDLSGLWWSDLVYCHVADCTALPKGRQEDSPGLTVNFAAAVAS